MGLFNRKKKTVQVKYSLPMNFAELVLDLEASVRENASKKTVLDLVNQYSVRYI